MKRKRKMVRAVLISKNSNYVRYLKRMNTIALMAYKEGVIEWIG